MSGQSLFLKSTENEGRSAQVEQFLAARGAGSGRLIFALDATASRKPTWDIARGLTGDMIREAASVGSLSLQLVYFRGGSEGPRECFTSNWMSDPIRLAGIMANVECRAGHTQINRVLSHTRHETLKAKVGALVLIGDACEPVDDNLAPHRGRDGDGAIGVVGHRHLLLLTRIIRASRVLPRLAIDCNTRVI